MLLFFLRLCDFWCCKCSHVQRLCNICFCKGAFTYVQCPGIVSFWSGCISETFFNFSSFQSGKLRGPVRAPFKPMPWQRGHREHCIQFLASRVPNRWLQIPSGGFGLLAICERTLKELCIYILLTLKNIPHRYYYYYFQYCNKYLKMRSQMCSKLNILTWMHFILSLN